jgi:signal transduction histidine kinase
LILEVSDDGAGIPASDRARIFERFFRGDAARTITDSEGTGLGLSIARAIVVTHGGEIDVASSSSGGALFRVRLPVLPVEANDASLVGSPAG